MFVLQQDRHCCRYSFLLSHFWSSVQFKFLGVEFKNVLKATPNVRRVFAPERNNQRGEKYVIHLAGRRYLHADGSFVGEDDEKYEDMHEGSSESAEAEAHQHQHQYQHQYQQHQQQHQQHHHNHHHHQRGGAMQGGLSPPNNSSSVVAWANSFEAHWSRLVEVEMDSQRAAAAERQSQWAVRGLLKSGLALLGLSGERTHGASLHDSLSHAMLQLFVDGADEGKRSLLPLQCVSGESSNHRKAQAGPAESSKGANRHPHPRGLLLPRHSFASGDPVLVSGMDGVSSTRKNLQLISTVIIYACILLLFGLFDASCLNSWQRSVC